MRVIVEVCVAFVQMCFFFILFMKVFGNLAEIFSTVCLVSFMVGVLLGLKN